MPSNREEAERRIEEARRTRAESLDLSGLALSELPANLGDLPDLKALYLGTNRLNEEGALQWHGDRKSPEFRDLTPLAGLKGLQNLDLSTCRSVTDIASLAGLNALRSLVLRGCTGVTDIAPLADLNALQNLDLSTCWGVTNLAPLAGLNALESLVLSSCTGVTDLAPLAGLNTLQSLVLSSCTSVTDLAPLAGLNTLQSLHLRNCTGITDLAPLASLNALQSLELSYCTRVTDLAPLASLNALQSLELSYCAGVTDLAPLASLNVLQSLELSYCTRVTDLAPLVGRPELLTLDIRGVQLTEPVRFLRALANDSQLTKLLADQAASVPREILSRGYADNCLPRLRTYFSELSLGAETENEVRIILLGNGRVGKTQLCRRFREQPYDSSIESTHGVQIWREKLRIQAGGQDHTFQVNWWDFGGQDIYHGTHVFFLRSRAVFVILWAPQLENRDEYEENGIPLRNQPLAYWLEYVRTLAGEDSPVLVVQSQCDRFADRLPAPQRPSGIGFFECCAYSAKEDLGRETLEAYLLDAIRYLHHRNGALEIGRGQAEVRRRLYSWQSEDQQLEPASRRYRTLTVQDFRMLCDEVGDIGSWKHALDYLHRTGVVSYRPDLFSDLIVLDQNWALDAVYSVFHRGRVVPCLRDSGLFTREDLEQLVWNKHSIEEQRLFLGLMESCGVCFACGKASKGETRYVAPDLLPRFETVKDQLYNWKEDSDTTRLRFEYRFFHTSIIGGLMSQVGRRAGDLAVYWKYGLWLYDGRRDTQLLVRFEDTRFEDTRKDKALGAGALELQARGSAPLELLHEIRWALLEQRIGDEPEEFLTVDGIKVARSALVTMSGDGRVGASGRASVPAGDFLRFFESREFNSPPNREARETTGIRIDPQPQPAEGKPREVFISYAWGDDTPAGKIRAEVVDRLQVALESDGFQPLRDRDRIHYGERISTFINRLTRADLVVAVISDKYLRSQYCMYEIYRLWQRSQGAATDLGLHVVPIVLPGVRAGNLFKRAVYWRHWAKQAKALETLVRNPGYHPSPKTWEKNRLTQEFHHHVDDILDFLEDVLMPQKLDVQLEDGFEAVRAALRRRIEPA